MTSLLEQQTLTKERLEKHVQGLVTLSQGGLIGLHYPLKARDVPQTPVHRVGGSPLMAAPKKKKYLTKTTNTKIRGTNDHRNHFIIYVDAINDLSR